MSYLETVSYKRKVELIKGVKGGDGFGKKEAKVIGKIVGLKVMYQDSLLNGGK